MAEVTLEFLGEEMERLFGELRRMDGKLDGIRNGIAALAGASAATTPGGRRAGRVRRACPAGSGEAGSFPTAPGDGGG
jgi:hypothetical protein